MSSLNSTDAAVPSSSSSTSNENPYHFYKSQGVWKWFKRHTNGRSAECQVCTHRTILAIPASGSPGSLHNHLATHRNEPEIDKFIDDKSTVKTEKRKESTTIQMTNFFDAKEPFDKIVARLVCLESVPFSRFEKSKDLKSYFGSKGYTLTESGTQIREIIINYSNKERKIIAGIIRDFLNEGWLCSLTMDEWTSVANRRYANVNVHINGQVFNLGLWRCFGSMTAAECVKILTKILEAFDMTLSDVVGITTDAAPVMVSMGMFI